MSHCAQTSPSLSKLKKIIPKIIESANSNDDIFAGIPDDINFSGVVRLSPELEKSVEHGKQWAPQWRLGVIGGNMDSSLDKGTVCNQLPSALPMVNCQLLLPSSS